MSSRFVIRSSGASAMQTSRIATMLKIGIERCAVEVRPAARALTCPDGGAADRRREKPALLPWMRAGERAPARLDLHPTPRRLFDSVPFHFANVLVVSALAILFVLGS